MDDGRARYHWLRWLTIWGPTGFVTIAETVRFLYLRYVLSPAAVSLVAIGVTLLAAVAFSTYVFSVISRLEQERNRYRESMLALRERERLAREMHDGLAQDLAALNLKLHHLRELATGSGGTPLAEGVDEAQSVLDHCYREVRQTLYDLRAGNRLSRGFWPALVAQLGEFSRQTGIEVVWSEPPGVKEIADQAVSVQLLRIVQEALANVRKHASARRVTIEWSQDAKTGRLAVRDDGTGFDGAHVVDGQHFGLSMMRERAESVGAEVEVTSTTTEGTAVEIRWPTAQGGELHRKRKNTVGG